VPTGSRHRTARAGQRPYRPSRQEIVVLPDTMGSVHRARRRPVHHEWLRLAPSPGLPDDHPVLEGELDHRDTAGGFGVLGPRDAQYMVAGLYAMHYELAHGGPGLTRPGPSA